jgi:hypothetical protein
MPKLIITIDETSKPVPNYPDHSRIELECSLEIKFEPGDSRESILPKLAPLFRAAVDAAIGASPKLFDQIESTTQLCPIHGENCPKKDGDFPHELED